MEWKMLCVTVSVLSKRNLWNGLSRMCRWS